ncbi:hypothetical protein [Kordiimonas sp.]|uniref:hypothetical protein n=1 Tax=Kordiimonas sp. TaxID=1970157 RepID=UPI003A906A94
MLANRVRELTTTSGASDITLAGALAGHVRFRDAFAVGDAVSYVIEDGDNYEIGTGTMLNADTLARTTVLETLVDGVLDRDAPEEISLSGNARVFCAATAEFLTRTEIGTSTNEPLTFKANDTVYLSIDPSGEIRATGSVIAEGGEGTNPAYYFDHDDFAEHTSNFIDVDRTAETMRFTVAGGVRFTAATDSFTVNTNAAFAGNITVEGSAAFNGASTVADTSYDDIILGNPTGNHGITIKAGTGSVSGIAFADSDTTGVAGRAGLYQYRHAEEQHRWLINDNLLISLSSSQYTVTPAMTVGGAFTANGHVGIASTKRMRVGGTPRTDWNTALDVLELGETCALTANASGDTLLLGSNWYLDASSGLYKYRSNGTATQYLSNGSGDHKFRTASSGSLGGDITWTDVLTVSSTAATLGSDRILRTVSSGQMVIAGGSSASDGGNIFFYGSTHATNAGDTVLRSGSDNIMFYDASNSLFRFYDSLTIDEVLTVSGVANFAGQLNLGNTDILRTVDNSTIRIGSSTGTGLGWNLIGYGSGHSTRSGDFEMRNDTTSWLSYDASTNSVSFYTPIHANSHILRSVDNDALIVSGGNATGSGANACFYGGEHATKANNTEFRTGTTAWLSWDASAAMSTFVGHVTVGGQYLDITNTENPTLRLRDTATGVASSTRTVGIIQATGLSTTGVERTFGSFTFDSTTATNGSEDGRLVLRLSDNGSVSDMLYFYNSAAQFQVAATFTDDVTATDFISSASGMWKSVNTSSLRFSGGNGNGVGANITMYGGDRATNENDILFRIGSNPIFQWSNDDDYFTFHGNDVVEMGNITSNGTKINVNNTADSAAALQLRANRGAEDQNIGIMEFYWNTTRVASIFARSGGDTANKDNASLVFATASEGTAIGRLEISEEGVFDFKDNTLTAVSVISRGTTNSDLILSGGSAYNMGANIRLRGESHATEANDIVFAVGGSTVANFDYSASLWNFLSHNILTQGRLNIGPTTFLNWSGAYDSIQIGSAGALMSYGSGANTYFMDNTYYDGANFKRIVEGEAASHRMFEGAHYFRVAGDDTADSNITWLNALVIDVSGAISCTDNLTVAGIIKGKADTTGNRPSAASVGAGATMFDTTLGKPIWSDGSQWVDAAGAAA